MKRILFSIASAIAVAISGVSVTLAQDGGPPNFVPVEMQVCNFNDGKDGDDLQNAMDEMVDWMEKSDSAPYAAWTLSKFFVAPNLEFDFLYLGAWPNGSTMGKDTAHYRSSAADAIAAFDDVAECPGTFLYASLNVKQPPENDGQGDGFVVTMSDCTVADGRKTEDAIAAIRAYGAYRDANGSPGGTYLWFPAYGGGTAVFDFKMVNTHASMEAFGNNYQWIVENAAYRKQGELLDGLVDCDVARAYAGDTVVNTMAGN